MFFIHLHVTSWLLAFILFLIAWPLYVKGKSQTAIILHWIIRISYVIILISGSVLLYRYSQAEVWQTYSAEVIVKAAAGLWAVVMLEATLHRMKGGKPFKGFTVQLVVMFAITLILGFGRLPWGFLP
ncbi:Protein of unknown function [Amphibacillus marinus]|uniref:Uncharacterized protein n=1 Tax=Amphibacillus marinus TaxID=872970 RepID=A0A1H8Q730_9BACI|nr:YisL family protein [Amphibacillus marinus]SEO50045.1 Protein of unknown function [Amphibacillus marinus]